MQGRVPPGRAVGRSRSCRAVPAPSLPEAGRWWNLKLLKSCTMTSRGGAEGRILPRQMWTRRWKLSGCGVIAGPCGEGSCLPGLCRREGCGQGSAGGRSRCLTEGPCPWERTAHALNVPGFAQSVAGHLPRFWWASGPLLACPRRGRTRTSSPHPALQDVRLGCECSRARFTHCPRLTRSVGKRLLCFTHCTCCGGDTGRSMDVTHWF